ncbi:hypothetical protein BKI52_03750 [marine bacterium AO1-C]|nr:hypothetical protein BKI52_03750 [marine bacterium AO1-C]
MFSWIKNKLSDKETYQLSEWRTDDSIYNFIGGHLDEKGRLPDSIPGLPDEPKGNDNEIKFAAGFADTLFGKDDSAKSKRIVNKLVDLLEQISLAGGEEDQAKFYEIITSQEAVIGFIDLFLDKTVGKALEILPHLYSFAFDLAFKSAHRNGVKFGVALLGFCQKKEVIPQIIDIGVHDEFTVFSAVAIENLSNDPEYDLWKLAQRVDGWGKIQTMDRLVLGGISSPDIKEWMLLEGYKNSIMYEYLAHSCAMKGELHLKISEERIDASLFEASSDIIEALIMGGPAEDIYMYEFAALTVSSFVKHANVYGNDVRHFVVLHKIKRFLEELQKDAESLSQNGWNQRIVANCLAAIDRIVEDQQWRTKALESMETNADHTTYWYAKEAAEILGLDVWEHAWKKVLNDPLNSSYWYDIMTSTTEQNIDKVIQLALEKLPLQRLATGPKDSLGIGPEFQVHSCIEFVITLLEKYPNRGEEIILFSLRSSVTRTRNITLKTLHEWGKSNWSEDVKDALIRLKSEEPNKDTKKTIARVLSGKSLDY